MYKKPLDSTLECRSYQPWVKKEDVKIDVRDGFTWRTVDYAEKHFTSLSYDTWKALFRVSGQGPDKQDTLLIEVRDNYSWDE